MPDPARQYTVDEVLAFPDDGNRYELVDGELLVTPAPAQVHQLVLGRLYGLVQFYLQPHSAIAQVFLAPGDIIWGPRQYVQPDLFVVPAHEVTGDWRDCQTLLLAVEVLSPSSAKADRLIKRRLYQRLGVATYWAVDSDARLVAVWHPGDERPQIVSDVLRWKVAAHADELEIQLDELFRNLPLPKSRH